MLETIGRTKADFEDEKVLSSDVRTKVPLLFLLFRLSFLHFFKAKGCTFADSFSLIYNIAQKQLQKIGIECTNLELEASIFRLT